MKTTLYDLLCRLAAKLRPDLVRSITSADGRESRCLPFTYAESRIDFEMEETARLRFIVANPMQFDPQAVAEAKQELQFRSDFQQKTAVTISISDQ